MTPGQRNMIVRRLNLLALSEAMHGSPTATRRARETEAARDALLVLWHKHYTSAGKPRKRP